MTTSRPLPTMTWRKLFHRLLIASTLVLAAAWVCSLWYRTEIVNVSHTLSCAVVQGTVEATSSELVHLGAIPPPVHVGPPLSIRQTAVATGPAGHPFGRWQMGHHTTPWEFGSRLGSIGPEGLPVWSHATIHFPLWLPWVVFVGCAFAFRKLMERRSGSGKEKELAERHEETGASAGGQQV